MKANFVVPCSIVLLTFLRALVAAETDCSTPIDPKMFEGCCELPQLYTEEIKELCQDNDEPMMMHKNRPPPPTHPGPQGNRPHFPMHLFSRFLHHPCFTSCAFNETGILNEDQQFDEVMLQDYLTATFEDDNVEWIPIFEDSFKTCIKRHEERQQFFAAHHDPEKHPEPRGKLAFPCMKNTGFIVGCVYKESFQKCPTNFWQDNENCNNIRVFLEDCMPPK